MLPSRAELLLEKERHSVFQSDGAQAGIVDSPPLGFGSPGFGRNEAAGSAQNGLSVATRHWSALCVRGGLNWWELGEHRIEVLTPLTGDPSVNSAQSSQVDSTGPLEDVPSNDARSFSLIVAPR